MPFWRVSSTNRGGHSGKADDYHYHIAPLHLQALIGADKPIAYALDGYAIGAARSRRQQAYRTRCIQWSYRDQTASITTTPQTPTPISMVGCMAK
jgi:hypothetical protein